MNANQGVFYTVKTAFHACPGSTIIYASPNSTEYNKLNLTNFKKTPISKHNSSYIRKHPQPKHQSSLYSKPDLENMLMLACKQHAFSFYETGPFYTHGPHAYHYLILFTPSSLLNTLLLIYINLELPHGIDHCRFLSILVCETNQLCASCTRVWVPVVHMVVFLSSTVLVAGARAVNRMGPLFVSGCTPRSSWR